MFKRLCLALLFINLLGILTTCTHLEIFRLYKSDSDPKLEDSADAYVDQFFITATKYGYFLDKRPLTVKVVEFPDKLNGSAGIVGKCYYAQGLEGPYVVLRAEFWKDATPTTKKVLVFHELGHCMLLREHTEELLSDDLLGRNPKSIMNPAVLRDEVFLANEQYYIDELFINVPEEFKVKHLNFKGLQSVGETPAIWYNFKVDEICKSE